LHGSKCLTCNAEFFPQRQFCPNCRRKGKLVKEHMPMDGTIYSYTYVHSAPEGFEYHVPYFMAIIELKNGVRLMSQLADSEPESVKINASVRMVFRRVHESEAEEAIAYGYKFKVVD